MKTRCPRPLDDGDTLVEAAHSMDVRPIRQGAVTRQAILREIVILLPKTDSKQRVWGVKINLSKYRDQNEEISSEIKLLSADQKAIDEAAQKSNQRLTKSLSRKKDAGDSFEEVDPTDWAKIGRC